jgi:hypothetical protein
MVIRVYKDVDTSEFELNTTFKEVEAIQEVKYLMVHNLGARLVEEMDFKYEVLKNNTEGKTNIQKNNTIKEKRIK